MSDSRCRFLVAVAPFVVWVGLLQGVANAVETLVKYRPAPIPLSEPDILNPGRGYYNELWYEFFWVDWNKRQSPADSGYFYNRYLWSEVEPQQGVYQFSAIDRDIARARAAGRKFGFRIMPHNNNVTGVPQYIASLGGSWVDGGFWPKWDNDFVIERMDKLYAALSAKYDGNPAVAFLDFGLYGKWGEWHGEPSATLATRKKIADIHLKYWKKTRLLMQYNDDSLIVKYVMEDRPRIGARADNIGSWIFDGFNSTDPVTGRNWYYIGEITRERWKTAPIITEWCGCGDTPENALRQVKDRHVVALGDNSSFTTNREIGKALGFRFVLDSLNYPADVVPGVKFAVRSWWSNAGVTPAYERWEVRYEFYSQQGMKAFSLPGTLDFENFLPGRRGHIDTVQLPSTAGSGAYTLKMAVVDPSGYYPRPLALAVRGVDTTGRYPLGRVNIAGSTAARVVGNLPAANSNRPVAAVLNSLTGASLYGQHTGSSLVTLGGKVVPGGERVIRGDYVDGVYLIKRGGHTGISKAPSGSVGKP